MEGVVCAQGDTHRAGEKAEVRSQEEWNDVEKSQGSGASACFGSRPHVVGSAEDVDGEVEQAHEEAPARPGSDESVPVKEERIEHVSTEEHDESMHHPVRLEAEIEDGEDGEEAPRHGRVHLSDIHCVVLSRMVEG